MISNPITIHKHSDTSWLYEADYWSVNREVNSSFATCVIAHHIILEQLQIKMRWNIVNGLLSFPPSWFWYQTLSPPVANASINIVILLQYVTLMHWHRLATRGQYQLWKVLALYNSSAHAHKLCHWSCSVISWSGPRFQERRPLLLVHTKHSSSDLVSDWLGHNITFPFLDSYWSTCSTACASALQLIALSCKKARQGWNSRSQYIVWKRRLRTYLQCTKQQTHQSIHWGAIIFTQHRPLLFCNGQR